MAAAAKCLEVMLTLLLSERPILYTMLAFLSAIGLIQYCKNCLFVIIDNLFSEKFSSRDMMTILRDIESGINMADRTTGSQVSVLSPGASGTPCCHWLTAVPDPNTCMFKPFIFGPHPDIGKSTISPDYGAEDPRRVIPRFQKTVDRGHELYKGHLKLVDLLGKDDPTANMVLENIRELENNCIGDVEEILNNYTEESFSRVATLFKHMCDIEMNFYKMIHPGKF